MIKNRWQISCSHSEFGCFMVFTVDRGIFVLMFRRGDDSLVYTWPCVQYTVDNYCVRCCAWGNQIFILKLDNLLTCFEVFTEHSSSMGWLGWCPACALVIMGKIECRQLVWVNCSHIMYGLPLPWLEYVSWL